jgi:hypothetical protein
VGAASALAGALLLASSLWADLAIHDREGHALLQQLSPQAARIVAEHEAREEANPWHRSLMAGEAFLIVGLGALYLTERARRIRGQGSSARSAPSSAGSLHLRWAPEAES